MRLRLKVSRCFLSMQTAVNVARRTVACVQLYVAHVCSQSAPNWQIRSCKITASLVVIRGMVEHAALNRGRWSTTLPFSAAYPHLFWHLLAKTHSHTLTPPVGAVSGHIRVYGSTSCLSATHVEVLPQLGQSGQTSFGDRATAPYLGWRFDTLSRRTRYTIVVLTKAKTYFNVPATAMCLARRVRPGSSKPRKERQYKAQRTLTLQMLHPFQGESSSLQERLPLDIRSCRASGTHSTSLP